MKAQPSRPRLGPVKRVAHEIGVPYTSFRDAIARGEIPVLRVGRAMYVEYTDVDHWIDSRKETAA